METTERSVMKIYSSSTDKLGNRLLYQCIVRLAKEKGIAGVTVYRGIMGFGLSSGHISSSRYWELTEKLPVTIEIIDETRILEEFYRHIEPMLLSAPKGILITIEPVKIMLHKSGNRPV
jgi:PII-like signaling protein